MFSVLAPTFVSPNAPLTPLLSVMFPTPPTVEFASSVTGPPRLAAPAALFTSAPLPPTPAPWSVTGSPPTAMPLRSSVAGAATMVPPTVLPSAVKLPTISVPVFTFVAPL